jgi:hypothetical protein
MTTSATTSLKITPIDFGRARFDYEGQTFEVTTDAKISDHELRALVNTYVIKLMPTILEAAKSASVGNIAEATVRFAEDKIQRLDVTTRDATRTLMQPTELATMKTWKETQRHIEELGRRLKGRASSVAHTTVPLSFAPPSSAAPAAAATTAAAAGGGGGGAASAITIEVVPDGDATPAGSKRS